MKTIADSIDWPRFLARHDLVWETLPEHWHAGALLGNGLLGAMIYSGGRAALRWDIGRSDVTEMSVMKRHHRIPIGHMVLAPAGRVLSGSMRLDLWNAEAAGGLKTERGEIRWRSFIHAEAMVMTVELQTSSGEQNCRWEWQPNTADLATSCEPLPQPPGKTGNENEVSFYRQPFLDGGESAVAWTENRISTGARTLYLSVGCSRGVAGGRQDAINSVRQAAGIGFSNLTASHRRWWHAYYPQSFVSLADTRMESFYWIQMYKLGSATRADRPAIDVLGPWYMVQTWPAIWWNLNIQVSYWPVYAANRLELGESLCRLLDRNMANLINNVPELYRPDCAAIGRVTGYDCSSAYSGGVPEKGNELCNLPFACHNYWLQYRHAMDDGLLKERLYPLLRRSMNFYLRLLKEGPDGRMHLPEAVSPEYPDHAPDCNVDLAFLRWGCQALIAACERLKIEDPLLPRWRETLRRIADYPADENGFMIGRGVPFAKSHRHPSHLVMIHPLHLVNWERIENRELVERSFDRWINLKGAQAGYSYAWASAFCSCLNRPDDAVRFLNDFLDRYPTANTMYLETAPASSGLEGGALIETPLAGANAIQELLMQSWGGKIRIFPGVPAGFGDVCFHQLRAEGGFLVSAARQGGQTRFVQVKSLAGEPCVVASGLRPPVEVRSDRVVPFTVLTDGSIRADMRKGETILLFSRGPAPEPVVEPIRPVTDELNCYGERKIRPVWPRSDGSIRLLASQAQLHGSNLRYEQGGRKNHIANWVSAEDLITWEMVNRQAGKFRVTILYSCPEAEAGSRVRLAIGEKRLTFEVAATPANIWEPYYVHDLGPVEAPATNKLVVSLRATEIRLNRVMNFFKLALVPANKVMTKRRQYGGIKAGMAF